MTDLTNPRSRSLSEMEGVLKNYDIILMKAVEIDREYENSHTQQLLRTIFKSYMPKLEKEVLQLMNVPEYKELASGVKATVDAMKQFYIESKGY